MQAPAAALASVSMSSSACDLLCFVTLWAILDPAEVSVLGLTGPTSIQAKAAYALAILQSRDCMWRHA